MGNSWVPLGLVMSRIFATFAHGSIYPYREGHGQTTYIYN